MEAATPREVSGERPGGAAEPSAAPWRPRPVSLRANFGWTFAGQVVYAGSQWVLIAAIANLGTPEAVGRFALGLATTGPVFLLAAMHLRGVQATDAARTFAFGDYLGVRLGAMGVALACATAVGLLGYDGETGRIVLAVGVSKAVEGLSDVHYGLQQQSERMRAVATSLVWRGLLSVIAVGGVLLAGGSLLAAVLAQAGAWVAVLLLHDVRAALPLLGGASGLRPRFHGATVRRLVALALPLGLVMMAVSLRTNVPRYFIERTLGTAGLGVFAALYSFVAAGTMVVSALGQSASPRLARHHHAGDIRAFRRLLRRLMLMAAALGAGGVTVAALAGRPLLDLVFGPEYAARADVLVVLMVAGAVAYAGSFCGYALTAARLFKVQLPLFATTTAACAAACAWLVPAHGLRGAAAAWGLALVLEIAASLAVLERALRARAGGR
jgi:O-antigen/teichoic acid export membrane protein